MLTTALLALTLSVHATSPDGSESDLPASAESSDVAIPFEEYDLDNGLHVILSEDHSVPFVWVNLWYRVGAKDGRG